MEQDCNRCAPTMRCRGKKHTTDQCKNFKQPYDKWKFSEMILSNPTGLNESLSVLPFDVNIKTIIEGK